MEPKPSEVAIGEVTSDESFNAGPIHSTTTKEDNEQIESVNGPEHLDTISEPTESVLPKSSHEAQDYTQSPPSMETVPVTRLQYSNHPSFDVESDLRKSNGVEFGGIQMEQENFQIENNEIPPDGDDPQPKESVSLREKDVSTGESQEYESGAHGTYQHNPFEEVSEGPEIEGDIFKPKSYDVDDRLGPKSQGYANDDDPERGNAVAHIQYPENGDMENASDLFSSSPGQQEGKATDKVVALFQAPESVSENITALISAAHRPADSIDPTPKGIQSEELHEINKESTDASADIWWGSEGNDEDFGFGKQEDVESFDGTLNQPKDVTQDISNHVEHSQQDPFAEILQGNEQALTNSFASKSMSPPADLGSQIDEHELTGFIDEKDFAELFPMVSQDISPMHTHTEHPPSSSIVPMDSLFGETSDAVKLFNGLDSPPGVPQKDDAIEERVPPNSRDMVNVPEAAAVSKNTPVADEPLDDLDFIDDSEFMAAFGALDTTVAAPAVSVDTGQSNETDLSQRNRYLPQQPSNQPPQRQYSPQQTTQFGVPSQQSTSSLNKYAPLTAPRPSSQGVPPTKSPQVPPQQPSWNNQQTALRPPPNSQAPIKPSTSFVTAKGAYSSPYDLPPQIAVKPKRHILPPVATYQQTPIVDTRPPLPSGPSPRSVSAQPYFSPPQRFQPPGGQLQNQYIPPKMSSPPLRTTGIQGQNQYEAKRAVPPPTRPTAPTNQTMYAPRREFSPPTKVPHDGHPVSQNMYAPGSVSPPVQHQHIGSHTYAPENVVLPQTQRDPREPQFLSGTMSQPLPPTKSPPPPAPPSSRYAPTQKLLPNRAVLAQQIRPPMQPAWQGRGPDVDMPPYDQQQISPPSSRHIYSNHHYEVPGPQTQAMNLAQHPGQPLSTPQSNFGAPHSHYQTTQPPFQVAQDGLYLPPLNEVSQYERDHHADLPPHFQMESGDYEQMHDPEGLSELPLQLSDRNIMRTPEPVEPAQPESVNGISPQGPWERAASFQDQRSPPKQRPFSPYDPVEPNQVPHPPLIPQSTTDRRHSMSPQITRGFQPSPKGEPSIDKSQSYPLRKPPAHLRMAMGSPAPRTLEEDFHARRGGYPVVSFGFGGQMITMIPRTPHRVNVRGPAQLSVPGMITFSSLRQVTEPSGLAASFPGPLYSANKPIKGKGKEILKWLDDNLALLDRMRDTSNLTEDNIHRIEDRRVLLKVLKLLIDSNGALDGKYSSSMGVLTTARKLIKSLRKFYCLRQEMLLPRPQNHSASQHHP